MESRGGFFSWLTCATLTTWAAWQPRISWGCILWGYRSEWNQSMAWGEWILGHVDIHGTLRTPRPYFNRGGGIGAGGPLKFPIKHGKTRGNSVEILVGWSTWGTTKISRRPQELEWLWVISVCGFLNWNPVSSEFGRFFFYQAFLVDGILAHTWRIIPVI